MEQHENSMEQHENSMEQHEMLESVHPSHINKKENDGACNIKHKEMLSIQDTSIALIVIGPTAATTTTAQ
jgi:hypothetical protein